ncbi:ATP phosphoribosyltransferase regulatory subunit [Orenia metallireducens]|uniref:ATP phosphoribosyltransferase regulatory subunit n=1 Tax=Orenia metallireducens TaxID=1413210 RepID=A0A285GPX4_9FIRM|nr:ATP phosphoribosyltransferase regulatory subunit [Orenia metallireducens]SNY25525.1 ATP phosphoribosyltransferase regulatory subunit [Orenia metallireducens]
MIKLQRPEGTRDYLPEVAEKKRYIEDKLHNLFKGWGYEEIITPTFEFYDILSAGTEGLQTKMYKFFDRKGQILALRPEMTASIARVAATKLKDNPLPLRLSYQSNVFRYTSPRAGQYREFYQAGIELLGVGSPMGDAEVIAMAAKAIKGSGLKNFKIDIGDVDYFTGIMKAAKLEEEEQIAIRKALSQRNVVELEELLTGTELTNKQKDAILSAQELRGGIEIIEKAKGLVDNQESLESLINLEEVYRNLELLGVSDYICIDLSVVRNFNYYTGIVFEGYTKDLGYTICGGGRYDRLVSKFGYSIPATGFAIGIDRLLLSLEKQNYNFPLNRDRILVLIDPAYKAEGFAMAEELREKGKQVEIEIFGRELVEVIEYTASKGLELKVVGEELQAKVKTLVDGEE